MKNRLEATQAELGSQISVSDLSDLDGRVN